VNLKSQNSKFKTKEELELIAIDAGAEDLYWYDDNLDIYCEIKDLEKVKEKLKERGVKIDSATLDWKPKEMIDLDEKKKQNCLKLFEALDELDSVQEIFSNLKI
jgi:transcriptional/translational regulatory protein YebC/TACO1